MLRACSLRSAARRRPSPGLSGLSSAAVDFAPVPVRPPACEPATSPAAAPVASRVLPATSEHELAILRQIETKANWLSCLMVHNANNVRPKRDGLKVGGHQASSASLSTILTALYARVLEPQDRVAVKPHASPLYHALQYLMGRQTLENLQAFRSFGGVQVRVLARVPAMCCFWGLHTTAAPYLCSHCIAGLSQPHQGPA